MTLWQHTLYPTEFVIVEAKPRAHLSTNQQSWQGWEPGIPSGDRTVVGCQGRASLNPGEAPNSIEKELRDSILCLSFFIWKMENDFLLIYLLQRYCEGMHV